MIEASVVGMRKDNDQIPLLLDDFVDLDATTGQQLGGDHADFVAEEVVADLGPVGEQFLGSELQFVGIAGGHTVPGLGGAIVKVVDPVQIHVLNMPRECRLPHSKIKVSSIIHPSKLLAKIIKDWLIFTNIPNLPIFINQRSGDVSAVNWIVTSVYEIVAP